jgi:hypothetical protein
MSERHLRNAKTTSDVPERWYAGADVPMAAIRRYAQEIADRFKPQNCQQSAE